MKITEDHIQRFFKGQCSAHEAEAVGNYLIQHTDDAQYNSELAEWKVIIEDTTKPLPEQQRDRMLKIIKSNLNESRINYSIQQICAVAATILLVAFAGLSFYFSNQQQHHQLVSVNRNITPGRHVVNNSHKIMVLTLKDGSKVSLYPNAQISFAEGAFVTTRVISLQGKAVFDVAKDKSRPFTVKSAAVSTTALGTVFMVDASTSKQSLVVQLFEGRVLVQSLNPISGKQNQSRFMEPDQQFIYEKQSGRITMNSLNKQSEKSVFMKLRKGKVAKSRSANLVFVREPVENVFSIIEQAYATELFYQKEAFKNHYFSGSFHIEKDSLVRVLRILSETNNLHIIKIKSGYKIKNTLINKNQYITP